jgi:aminoglycoside phosphotransferase (APT) family kinase protein
MTSPLIPLAAYEVMPSPTLTDDQLRAIVERHRIELDGPVVSLRSSGVVHSLWALGSRWVLRVPKNETMCLGDHRCEAVAIPLALAAGVRTPALHVFDDSLTILDVPFSIVSRVHGRDLSADPFGHPSYEHVGRELATLHAADLGASHHPWLRETYEPAAEELFDHVVRAGLLHRAGTAWVASLCERLDGVIAPHDSPTVFVHCDVKPDNVMIDSSGDVQLIDWGDAGFGDPAYDFQSLPMHSIEVALRGYRSVHTDDPALEARIVRRVLARSLANLSRAPLAGPSWYRPVAANLTDLLTFAIDRRRVWESWLDGSATLSP